MQTIRLFSCWVHDRWSVRFQANIIARTAHKFEVGCIRSDSSSKFNWRKRLRTECLFGKDIERWNLYKQSVSQPAWQLGNLAHCAGPFAHDLCAYECNRSWMKCKKMCARCDPFDRHSFLTSFESMARIRIRRKFCNLDVRGKRENNNTTIICKYSVYLSQYLC